MIPQIQNLNYLSLRNPQADFSWVAGMTELETLHIDSDSGDPLPNDLSTLALVADLTQLFTLRLTGVGLENAAGLEEFTNLRNLTISGNPITEIPQVAELEQLWTLRVSNNQLSSLPSLTAFSKLEEVDVSDNQLTSLDFITDAAKPSLVRAARNHITDIAHLAAFRENWSTIDVSEQLITLPDVPLGAPPQSVERLGAHAEPKIVLSSDSALVDADAGTWTLPTPGAHVISWDQAFTADPADPYPPQYRFSGSVQQTALPAAGSELAITDPSSLTVVAGETATFTSTAETAVGTTTVRWETRAGIDAEIEPVAGATDETLSLPKQQLANTGRQFRAVQTADHDGSVATSAWATLTVKPAEPGNGNTDPSAPPRPPQTGPSGTGPGGLPHTGAPGSSAGIALTGFLLAAGAAVLFTRRKRRFQP